MFYYDKKKICMSVILSVIIICSFIKPVNSGTFISAGSGQKPQDSYSISDGIEDMSAKEIIRALKTNIRQTAVQREEKCNPLYLPVSIVKLLITLLLIYGLAVYFKYTQNIKLWRVISYIHCLDGKKGGIIFYMI